MIEEEGSFPIHLSSLEEESEIRLSVADNFQVEKR